MQDDLFDSASGTWVLTLTLRDPRGFHGTKKWVNTRDFGFGLFNKDPKSISPILFKSVIDNFLGLSQGLVLTLRFTFGPELDNVLPLKSWGPLK